MSVDTTLEFLHRHVPGFPGLRRATLWPAPLGRVLVARWLKRRGSAAESAFPGSAAVVRAIRLIRRDDRSFCRRVHLEGWHLTVEDDAIVFELVDEFGDMLWPVALRALLLFAGARTREILPPQSATNSASDARSHRLAVTTHADREGGFRVVLSTAAS